MHVVGASAFGGASRVIADLIESQSEAYEVYLVSSEPRLGAIAESAGAVVVRDIDIVRRVSPARDLVAVVKLARALRRLRVELVHTHTTKGGIVGRLAAICARTPVKIHTLHNFGVSDSSSFLAKQANYAIERMLARATSFIVPVSVRLVEMVGAAHIAGPNKVIGIQNGIELLPVSPPPNGRELVVTYHGRLAAGKGIDELLEATALLVARGLRFRLDLFGEGGCEADLRGRASRLGLDEAMFRGFTLDVHSVLSASDVCVQPSHREGLSIALLEALRAGRCIVASDIGPNLEVLGTSAGLTYPVGDVEELAVALGGALADADRREALGRFARERFVANYDRDGMLARYDGLYRDALRAADAGS